MTRLFALLFALQIGVAFSSKGLQACSEILPELSFLQKAVGASNVPQGIRRPFENSVLHLLNVGSREDLGDTQVVRAIWLKPEDEEKVLNGLLQIQTASGDDPGLSKIKILAKQLEKALPKHNLFHRDPSTLEPQQLVCLPGAVFETFLTEDQETDLPILNLGLSEFLSQFGDQDLVNRIRSGVEVVVNHEERVWPDTILEGDYGLNGPAESTDIRVVLLNKKFLGATFLVQAPAVMTSESPCRYDERTKKWVGRGCIPGSISVAKSIDSNFKEVGSMNFAEFDN